MQVCYYSYLSCDSGLFYLLLSPNLFICWSIEQQAVFRVLVWIKKSEKFLIKEIIILALAKTLSLNARTEMALLYMQVFLETAALTSAEVTQLHYNKN